MQPEAKKYLEDIRQAVVRIQDFVGDGTWDDYEADALLRSAVERQFEIKRTAQDLASRPTRTTHPESSVLPWCGSICQGPVGRESPPLSAPSSHRHLPVDRQRVGLDLAAS